MPLLPGQFSTSLDLITSAFRLIGFLAEGEPLDGNQANDALVIANEMLDAWNAEKLSTFTINRQIVVPAVLKQVYTLGTGGDFNFPRPARLAYVSIISLQNAAQPLELPLRMVTDDEWMKDIPVKNISAQLAQVCWNDRAFPLMNLSFWPIPNTQVNFGLYMWALLTQFTDLGQTQYTYPPGYLRALRYNLAMEFDAEWNGDPTKMERVARIAAESKATIKAQNVEPLLMECDEVFSSSGRDLFNWLTGESVGR